MQTVLCPGAAQVVTALLIVHLLHSYGFGLEETFSVGELASY
jgi:hypothetical protein